MNKPTEAYFEIQENISLLEAHLQDATARRAALHNAGPEVIELDRSIVQLNEQLEQQRAELVVAEWAMGVAYFAEQANFHRQNFVDAHNELAHALSSHLERMASELDNLNFTRAQFLEQMRDESPGMINTIIGGLESMEISHKGLTDSVFESLLTSPSLGAGVLTMSGTQLVFASDSPGAALASRVFLQFVADRAQAQAEAERRSNN